jgi:hypothetical protein
VGRGNDGKAQLSGCLESGQSEGELGGQVNHIGPEPSNIIHDVAEPGKRPLHIGIEEERNAGRPMHFRPVGLSLGERVAGGVDSYLMAELLQCLSEPQQRHSDAAHHGPIDLGKKGDAHGIRLRRPAKGDKVRLSAMALG